MNRINPPTLESSKLDGSEPVASETATNDERRFPVLFSRLNYERTVRNGIKHFKLKNMLDLTARLNSPHLAYPVIHVAGTKGKGSVSTMIGSIFSCSGLKTGVYSSPHLETVRQRLVIDRQLVSESALDELLERMRPVIAEFDTEAEQGLRRPVTFFELITTTAFLHFETSEVDAAVIEVGLGGRLDSTNVCLPEVSVITNISLDHTRQLGDTVEQIAAEKAGIIKPGVPVVSGAINPSASEVIEQIAERNNSALYVIERDFFYEVDDDGRTFATFGKIEGVEYRIEGLKTAMPGIHQIANAAIAVAVAQIVKHRAAETNSADNKFVAINHESIAEGLNSASLAGRTEVIACCADTPRPTVILDMAHNVASISALIEAMNGLEQCNQAKEKTLIIAISRDKDAKGMLRLLTGQFDKVVITQYQTNPRCTSTSDLHEIATVVRDQLNLAATVETIDDPRDAWNRVLARSTSDDFVCITGSAFLIAELRPIFKS